MSIIENCLLQGFLFYGIMCLARYKSFKGTTFKERLLGFLFGVLAWPVALYLVVMED